MSARKDVTDLLGYQIAKAREAAQLSRAQLARRLGVTIDRLAGWEEGAAAPSGPRIEKLRTLLGEDFVHHHGRGREDGDARPTGGTAHGAPRVGRQIGRLHEHLRRRTMW